MSARDLLDNIRISSPCTADWDSMIGNDQVRFCQHCNLSVHHLSNLNRKQALRLIARSNGRLCVRYILLPDGSISTRPAPSSLYRIGRHASRLAAGAFSATLTVSAATAATASLDLSPSPFTHSTLSELPDSIAGNSAVGAGIRGFVFDQTLGIASIEASVEIRDEVVEIQGGAVMPIAKEPLVRAAQNDDIEAVKQLLVGKPNANARDKLTDATALEHAVLNSNREMVQVLLWAGADVNARDKNGRTPIMLLGDDVTPEIVWDLINAGAKVNLRDNQGDTALIEAAEYNNLEALKALLNAGALVNVKNNYGRSPLMRAASEGLVNNVRALILAGADVNARDVEGKTAWMLALDNQHKAVLRLLRSYGVDETAEPRKEPQP